MSTSLEKKDLQSLERRLRELHASMVEDLELLEEDAVGSAVHPIEQQGDSGVIDAAQETELGILEQDEDVLSEVVKALGRLEVGTYGPCEDCGSWIARERLEVLPYARRCSDCETRMESELPGRE